MNKIEIVSKAMRHLFTKQKRKKKSKYKRNQKGGSTEVEVDTGIIGFIFHFNL